MTDKERAVIEAARLVLGADSYETDCLTRDNLQKALAALDAPEAAPHFSIANCPDCGKFRGHGHECKAEPVRRVCRECNGAGGFGRDKFPQQAVFFERCDTCKGTGRQDR